MPLASNRFQRLALSVALVFAAPLASAQAWPAKPVHIVVAYAPGGTGDVLARIIAERLTPALGQTVVVENKPGASGMIGTQSVAKSPADGYTFLLGQTGEMVINKSVVKNMTYDTERDFAPVVLVGRVPLALVTPTSVAAQNVKELVAMAQKEPGKIAFASSGAATPGHLAAETLAARSNAKMVHVPYKGAGAAMSDLIGGHVAFFFSGMPAAIPHVKAGKLKLLAISTGKRFPTLPDTPTVTEATGIDGFDFSLWGGLFAPAGTPAPVVRRVNEEVNKILATPDIRTRMTNDGIEVTQNSPEAFAQFMRDESAKYARIIRDANITME